MLAEGIPSIARKSANKISRNLKSLNNKIKLKQFLGTINFYRRFVPKAIKVTWYSTRTEATDASNTTLGAVVQQEINKEWQPLAFMSKKLNRAQTKYSPYDRELLTIYTAVKHFRYLLEGRKFTIYTDHKLLIYAFQQDFEIVWFFKEGELKNRFLHFTGKRFGIRYRYETILNKLRTTWNNC